MNCKRTYDFKALIVKTLVLTLIICEGLTFYGCAPDNKELQLFTLLPSSQTGISFINELPEKAEFSIAEYLYYYNGGGVAVGDVNKDGLKDIFFTANLLPNKLYLNKGNFVFEDISESAGIEGIDGWSTGVAMVDVNGDGHLDIYVSQLANYKGFQGKNQLYINSGPSPDGKVKFVDRAEEFGVDFSGFGTQSSFFDYDNDGDLDMYLLNHNTHHAGNFGPATLRSQHDLQAGDRLMRNDLATIGKFVDVTLEAGIYDSPIGYGLAVTPGDINNDGCIDIFVSNDFHENDYLYINNCDGTFTEMLEKSMAHTSHSSMGNDLADFNNDGMLDIVVLDMLPEDEEILKKSVGEEPQNIFDIKIRNGYHPQVARNTLQLNQGNGLFSDIALFSGVSATDWSWAPLLCDLDNDGYKDLYITNGIFRRPNDKDYINFKWQLIQSETRNKSRQEIDEFIENKPELGPVFVDKMPSDKIANKVYQNNGDLTFTDKSTAWGMDQPVFSNGVAYVDLDNDGDLDMVVNNMNEKAFIYRNNADSVTKNNYLQVQLTGPEKNTQGIGAKVFLNVDGQVLYQEQMPVRGFLSTVDEILHFGVGGYKVIDTLTVIWPDRKMQVLTNVTAGKKISLAHKDASFDYRYPEKSESSAVKDVSDVINYSHKENEFKDYDWEFLIPHKLSTQGPNLAVGDVNGDGVADVYCGGAAYLSGQLYIQKPDGKFAKSYQEVFHKDSVYEDVGVVFLDADSDGDLDLYTASGGNEWSVTGEHLQDRLYMNDGKGHFTRSQGRIPADLVSNASCVKPADFDNDGDIDIFVGSRSVVNAYGISPRSYLLQNDGKGVFKDVIEDFAPGLSRIGMVTGAVWADIDQDEKQDLVVVGEWMPVSIFRNSYNKLTEITETAGLIKTNGWWNSILATDVDGDGDVDLVAGNLGLNSKIKASITEPATLHIKDFDRNGSLEQILCFYKQGVSTPFATLDELIKQMPSLRKKFPNHNTFSKVKTIDDIFTEEQLDGSQTKHAYTFESSYLENQGDGTFTRHALPPSAQISPIFSIYAGDFNLDNMTDLLIGGNFNGSMINYGPYDAGYGLLLNGNNQGGFDPIPGRKSGWIVPGEVRDIQKVPLADGSELLFVGRNNDSLRIFKKIVK